MDTTPSTDDPADGAFGESVAARYDDPASPANGPATTGPVADLLAGLAGDGAALELAVGTGRIALPLAARGVEVHGIELSRAMLRRLRDRPGGAAVPVTVGDMATTRLERRFSLVYLVFNTIMNLTTQDAQVECFANAARHLEPGGAFVVECMVPDLRRLPPGQRVVPFRADATGYGLDTYRTATQGLTSHHLDLVGPGHARHATADFRYVWPAELDLMARLAGLHLAERWSGWDRAPFTDDSTSHVSVWRS